MEKLFFWFREARGATAIEYGLIAALISVAAIVVIFATGTDISGVFGVISTALQGG
jgi:pilus assembly protein Flp/PilA